MALIKTDTFKFASTFYALDWDSFEYEISSKTVTGSVDAVWFKRQNGVTVCCTGVLTDTYNLERNNLVEGSITEAAVKDVFVNQFDGRYGGNTEARWDGENLWAPGLPMKEMMSFASVMDVLLKTFNDSNTYRQVPAGYVGWYSINGKV